MAASYGLMTVDIARQAQWNLSMYREATHPTVEGNHVLATVLAEAIRAAM